MDDNITHTFLLIRYPIESNNKIINELSFKNKQIYDQNITNILKPEIKLLIENITNDLTDFGEKNEIKIDYDLYFHNLQNIILYDDKLLNDVKKIIYILLFRNEMFDGNITFLSFRTLFSRIYMYINYFVPKDYDNKNNDYNNNFYGNLNNWFMTLKKYNKHNKQISILKKDDYKNNKKYYKNSNFIGDNDKEILLLRKQDNYFNNNIQQLSIEENNEINKISNKFFLNQEYRNRWLILLVNSAALFYPKLRIEILELNG